MEEIWKDIEGYEGLYQVSNHGRVKCLERVEVVRNRWGTYTQRTYQEKIMSPTFNNSGYLGLNLKKDGVITHRLIHRLVAETFIPNPNKLPCVNHKSELKTENSVDNLEWCDWAYNSNYGTCHYKTMQKIRKSIIGFDDIHKLGVYFQCAADADRFFAGKITGMTAKALKGLYKKGYGYRWEYA